jgi:hypothetical protein
VLAVIFLVAIFYTAWATFPLTLIETGAYFRDTNEERASIREQLNNEYRDMLEFSGNVPNDKGAYINLNGLMARLMGQREMNERVKLDNGHLSILSEKRDVTIAFEQLSKLCGRQRENGKQFLFVIAPSQIPKYEQILPIGYEDYANESADELLAALRENGVPVLDLRDELYFDNISYSEAFCVTDHHWTPKTGFWAYKKIIDYLAGSGIIDAPSPEYTDINAYNIEVFKNRFLGSSGKRTGIYFAGVDDFAVITPKFASGNMTVEIPSSYVYKQGGFAEIAYNMSNNRLDYFSANPYAAYGHSDNDFTRYRNESAPIDLKVMSIGDSTTNIPCTFLPLIFKACDELDMRYYSWDFERYYSDFDPDIVIVLIGAGSIDQPNATYDFFGDIGD